MKLLNFENNINRSTSTIFVGYSSSLFISFLQKYPFFINDFNVYYFFDNDTRNKGSYDLSLQPFFSSLVKTNNRGKFISLDIFGKNSLDIRIYTYSKLSDIISSYGSGSVQIIIFDDYYEEAYEKLKNIIDASGLSDKLYENSIYFYPSEETSFMLEYREKYAAEPLHEMILFRSGPHATQYVKGMDFADNARALFEYMLSQNLNEKYELVWLVKNPDEYRDIAEQNKNVSFIAFDWSTTSDESLREKYYRVLYLSKWIFMTDAYGFCRRPREGQIRVQLWHGCGFKGRVNFSRCEKRYEYNIVVSEQYKGIHAKLYGLRDDQVLITGYPKEDKLFHSDSAWKNIFDIPDASKYIFWMPTFRKPLGQLSNLAESAPDDETGLPVMEDMEEMSRLNQILSQRDAILIIKLHPFQDRNSIHIGEFSNIKILTSEPFSNQRVDINSIFGNADALISDYSSAAVDYMILDRPLAFTIDDADEYEESRGFVFKPIRDYLPGTLIKNSDDFISFINSFLDGRDTSLERRKKLMPVFHEFFDDQSSKRVLEAVGIID